MLGSPTHPWQPGFPLPMLGVEATGPSCHLGQVKDSYQFGCWTPGQVNNLSGQIPGSWKASPYSSMKFQRHFGRAEKVRACYSSNSGPSGDFREATKFQASFSAPDVPASFHPNKSPTPGTV